MERLREREEEVANDQYEGIRVEGNALSINDVYEMWCNLKRGIRDNTMQNYKHSYKLYVWPWFGKTLIKKVRKSDVKRFYNSLVDDRNLKACKRQVLFPKKRHFIFQKCGKLFS